MDVPEGGVQCEHFWSAGGCGGHDAGRCGVTGDGGLYAYYLDAVAWCQDDNPVSAATVGLGCECCGGSDGRPLLRTPSVLRLPHGPGCVQRLLHGRARRVLPR